MKTSWEKQTGKRTDYVDVRYNNVVVGHHYQTGMTDAAGTCTHEEFLKGTFQDLIVERFGPGVLEEVIHAVEHSFDNPEHIKKREDIFLLRRFIEQFPVYPNLASLVKKPGTINGADVYGNLGGYKSRIESDTTAMTFESTKCEIEIKKTGKTTRITLPFHLSRCVELHDRYYVIGGDNFHVISHEGTVLFTTDDGGLLFGYTLRFGNVFRNLTAVIATYRWFDGDYPDGCLSYEHGRGFTGRADLAG
ncbi:MAG: hypothetical protein JW881_13590 [Spirochaetales bacterium]|nr:hypothetical protein [Spirochaetales bacterium]